MRADGSKKRQLTRLGEGRRATFPDFSPSGRHVAFTYQTEAGALADIWTVRDDGRRPRPLTNTPDVDDAFPAWSPDGRHIVFLRRNADRSVSQVWTMDRHGRHLRQFTFDPAAKDQVPDWRPDGKKIAYQADGDIWLINPDGSGQVNITNTPDVQEFGTAWSPDGRRIAYLNFGERVVYTMRADGTDVRAVGAGLGQQFVPAWQPRRQAR
jgi:Tol biopolymer transport system component